MGQSIRKRGAVVKHVLICAIFTRGAEFDALLKNFPFLPEGKNFLFDSWELGLRIDVWIKLLSVRHRNSKTKEYQLGYYENQERFNSYAWLRGGELKLCAHLLGMRKVTMGRFDLFN